jgi:hypothetical protein
MRSRFNSPLQVVGDAVDAGGPLEWDPGETWAVVMVTITQKDDKIAGTAKSRFGSGQPQWTLSVNPETQKKFKNGPATASGMVCAYGDTVSVIQWEEQIDLQKDG